MKNSGENPFLQVGEYVKNRKIDMAKLSKLESANDMLDRKYGRTGTAQREEFDAKAKAWYYGKRHINRN